MRERSKRDKSSRQLQRLETVENGKPMSPRGGARRRPKPDREELVCHDDVRVKPLIVHVHSLRPPLAVCECDLLLRVPSGEPDLEAFPGAVLPGREGAAGLGVRGRAAIPVATAVCWPAGERRQNGAMVITDRIMHLQLPPSHRTT